MGDKINTTATGASAKPAETTVTQTGAQTPDATTSVGVEELLRSEFAKTDTATPPPKEVPGDEAKPVTDDTSQQPPAPASAETPANGDTPPAPPDEPAAPPAEGDDAPIEGLPDEVQAKVNDRIGKAVKQKNEATKERDALKDEVTALRAHPPMQPITAPAIDEKKLGEIETVATKFLNDAEAVLDDTATPEEKERVNRFLESNRLDPNALKRVVRDYTKLLDKDIPAQRQQLRVFNGEQAKIEPTVKTIFPWIDDAKHPDFVATQSFFGLIPELAQRTPGHRLARGIYALGIREFEKLLEAGKVGPDGKPVAATTAPARTTKPPTPPPTRNSSPATTAPKAKAEEAARTEFNKKPSRDTVINLLKQSLVI